MESDKGPYHLMANDLNAMQRESEMQSPMMTHTSPSAMHSQVNVIPVTSMSQMPTAPVLVGPQPVEMTCPSCRCRIRTKVRHRSTAKTHIACLLLSWTLICCCLPYCMDTCRNTNHFCPMCGAYVGTYQS